MDLLHATGCDSRAHGPRKGREARLTFRPAPPRALAPDEREVVLDTLHCERFMDRAPAQVHATLLDEGTYLCSPRTMYRILDSAQEVKERRDQVSLPRCPRAAAARRSSPAGNARA